MRALYKAVSQRISSLDTSSSQYRSLLRQTLPPQYRMVLWGFYCRQLDVNVPERRSPTLTLAMKQYCALGTFTCTSTFTLKELIERHGARRSARSGYIPNPLRISSASPWSISGVSSEDSAFTASDGATLKWLNKARRSPSSFSRSRMTFSTCWEVMS